MQPALDRVLAPGRQLAASDLPLRSGRPPIFRIKGELRTVRDEPRMPVEPMRDCEASRMNEKQRADYDKFYEVDLAYSTPDGVRYRCNIFTQRGNVGMVMRLIPPEVPPFERLNLPPVVLKLAEEERGLILVTGITGSG